MKITTISAAELGPAERGQWQALQMGNASLASPCFSFEYTLAAAAVRPDVRIAVLEQDNAVVGFFPFQQRWGAGLPVGGRLSDHHGVIAASGTRWDWSELLRSAGLSYWQFDHLAAWQRPPVPVHHTQSPGLNLADGFAAYRRRKLDSGTTLAPLPRKERKLAREVGPLRFEPDCRDDAVFATVIRLKSEQCRRTGQLDFFAWPWTRALVEHLRAVDNPAFGGRLSALYAGDTLVAAHFGIRSQRVWQWWFPVYSLAHSGYSPGLLLMMEVAQAAAAQGHALLDLGRGDEPYKAQFADCALPLVEGCVSRPALATLARTLRKGAGTWLRTSPVAQPLRPLVRSLRRASETFAADRAAHTGSS